MPSHFLKKFCWGTVFATGRKSFIELGTGLRMKRTNHRTRVPIGLYPCYIEEKMTIKELAMPSHFLKKFCWGTVFATGRKSFIELGTGLRMKRTNHRTRVPIGLYPCYIEEKMTIKEVKGELVME
nr:hypothetical protein [Tanacetum cinerariifolium]